MTGRKKDEKQTKEGQDKTAMLWHPLKHPLKIPRTRKNIKQPPQTQIFGTFQQQVIIKDSAAILQGRPGSG